MGDNRELKNDRHYIPIELRAYQFHKRNYVIAREALKDEEFCGHFHEYRLIKLLDAERKSSINMRKWYLKLLSLLHLLQLLEKSIIFLRYAKGLPWWYIYKQYPKYPRWYLVKIHGDALEKINMYINEQRKI